jgi:hypothetical protein
MIAREVSVGARNSVGPPVLCRYVLAYPHKIHP